MSKPTAHHSNNLEIEIINLPLHGTEGAWGQWELGEMVWEDVEGTSGGCVRFQSQTEIILYAFLDGSYKSPRSDFLFFSPK